MPMFFVAGTDTEIGKTTVATEMLKYAQSKGIETLGLKPIASDAEQTASGLRNQDALSLISASSHRLTYEQVNPYVFEPAIAPHIAAQQEGVILTAENIRDHIEQVLNPIDQHESLILIEGAGGWRVPLNDHQYFSDIPKRLDCPVVLVVGLRLGCINHALLTVEAIQNDGLKLAGWVANGLDPDMAVQYENIDTLKRIINAPFLGVLPYLDEKYQSSHQAVFNIEVLLNTNS